MNIQSRNSQTIRRSKAQTNQNPESVTLNKFTDAVANNPFRTIMDVADVGIGSALAFNAVGASGGDFVTGAGIVTGVAHTMSAIFTLAKAGSHADAGYSAEAKKFAVRGIGDGIAAAGMFAAAAGVGPVSLAFIGAGALTATLAR